MLNPNTEKAAQQFLISSLIQKFNIDVVVDEEFCRARKALAVACLCGIDNIPTALQIKMQSSDTAKDLNTLAHEVIHCIQFWTGRYKFNMPQLRRFMEFHKLEFDEAFDEWFLPFWRRSDYPREDFQMEYVAYYVSDASNGKELFQLLARQELK